MRILLVSATRNELYPFLQQMESGQSVSGDHELQYLETGVGNMSATYNISRAIYNSRPDYVIQAGVAGSFSGKHPPGSIALVESEIPADMGAAENGQFADIFDMQLADKDLFPYSGKMLVNPNISSWLKFGIPTVPAITVNEITTGRGKIEMINIKYNPVLESMEGAALHYVCLLEQVRFMQVRAVSNFVGERNKDNWKLRESVDLLHNQLLRVLPELE